MAKLTILSGLPASGKSTKAKEIVSGGGPTVRLNRDLLRQMLHFDKWTHQNEKMTIDAEKELAHMFLADGKSVVIDDTNLTQHHRDMWKQVAKDHEAKIEYIEIDTPWKLCVIRDWARQEAGERYVGEHVIVQTALANGLIDPPQKGYVVCDLDGTLCNIDHRLHYVSGDRGFDDDGVKDWKGFFSEIHNDTLVGEVFNALVDAYEEGYEIIFVSARNDGTREATEAWLNYHIGGAFEWLTVIMRRDNDHRPDTEVKEEILNKFLGGGKYIHKVFDDRPSVIRMWREHGLEVVDCGEGIEF